MTENENRHTLADIPTLELKKLLDDTYHPYLTPVQSGRILGHLRQGETDTKIVLNDDFLMGSIATAQLPKWAYVMARHEKLPEFFGACYQRFVIKIAKRRRGSLPIKDALSVGKAAVLEAVKDFDIAHDNQFFAFAQWEIFTQIKEAERKHLGITRYEQQSLHASNKLNAAFWSVFKRTPTNAELRNQLLVNSNLSVPQIDFALVHRKKELSLDASLGEDGDYTLYSTVADKKTDVASETVQHVTSEGWSDVIQKAMNEKLSPTERTLLTEAFGLDGKGRRTITEMAAGRSGSSQQVNDRVYEALLKMQLSDDIQDLEESPEDLPTKKPSLDHVIYEETAKGSKITAELQQQIHACKKSKDKVYVCFAAGFSTVEIASAIGLQKQSVRIHLHALHKEGKIVIPPKRKDLKREAEKDPLTLQVKEYLTQAGNKFKVI